MPPKPLSAIREMLPSIADFDKRSPWYLSHLGMTALRRRRMAQAARWGAEGRVIKRWQHGTHSE